MSSVRTDVAIIGAGPVGLFAVFECGMLKMRCHVSTRSTSPAASARRSIPRSRSTTSRAIRRSTPSISSTGCRSRRHPSRRCSISAPASSRWPARGGLDAGHLARRVDHRARDHRRRRRRRLRPEPAAARAACRVRRQVGPLPRQAARGFPRQALVIAGGGDSAVDWALSLAELASAYRRGASARQVPRRARERRQDEGARRLRPHRAWSRPTSCTRSRAAAACSTP
jgi:thioredoxin reductase (NADPH)